MNKPVIAAGALVLAVAAAAYTFWPRKADSQIPDTPETTTTWMCDGCGDHFSLSGREFAAWRDDPKRSPPNGDPMSRQTIFMCEKCKQPAVVRGDLCTDHQVWYVLRHIDGKIGDCPQCAKAAGLRR